MEWNYIWYPTSAFIFIIFGPVGFPVLNSYYKERDDENDYLQKVMQKVIWFSDRIQATVKHALAFLTFPINE